MSRFTSSLRRGGLALLFLALSSGVAPAQSTPKKELSEAVSSQLGQLRTLADAKNYQGIVDLLDKILATVPADSYDRALLMQIKGQVLLSDAKYEAALAPIELSLQLSDRYGFFDKKTTLLSAYTLSQLYTQEAASGKEPTAQKKLYDKAYGYIARWLDESPAPSPDNQYLAASLLYNAAMIDAKNIDVPKVRLALAEARKCLYLSVDVKTPVYVLILAALQQLGDTPQTVQVLEQLVVKEPKNSLYWQQLLATYYALASKAANDRETKKYNLLALLTFERAQANGLLDTPKDHFSVVGLYFNLQQYDRAAGLLAQGLRAGDIENTRRNWELLSAAYQQMHDDARVLGTLKEAAAAFPHDGQIEFGIAQFYYAQNDTQAAYDHLVTAVAKGHLDKPGQTYVFLAYVAYSMKRLDDAAKWIAEAGKQPDIKTDDVTRLGRAINDAIKERDAADASTT